jgi:hypothetical protein
MTELASALDANRAAVDDLMRAAEACGEAWTTPSAPGKWSPAQVVEHVAISLEEGADVVAGRPSMLPTVPAFLRPLAKLFLKRVNKTGVFPKSKTAPGLDPPEGPATPAEGRPRLEAALAEFARECEARSASGQPVRSPAFGTVRVEEYARFIEAHTRHHTRQLPAG